MRDSDELDVAYTRMLKTGLANLPQDGGDIETLVTERPGSPAETIEQLDRQDPRAIDFRNSIRPWFCNATWSTIKLVELRKWLYWALFYAELPKLEEIPDSHKTALGEAIALLEKRLGCKIPEGSNPQVVPMRVSLDRMSVHLRPFTFYFIICTINTILRKFYQLRWGVQYRHFEGIEYIFFLSVRTYTLVLMHSFLVTY